MARFERNAKKKQKYHEGMISHFNHVGRLKFSVDTEGRRIATEHFIIQVVRFSALLSSALRPYQVHRSE